MFLLHIYSDPTMLSAQSQRGLEGLREQIETGAGFPRRKWFCGDGETVIIAGCKVRNSWEKKNSTSRGEAMGPAMVLILKFTLWEFNPQIHMLLWGL